jgi:AraC-like DNA-binding protein
MIARPVPRDHFVLRMLAGYAEVLADPAVAMDPLARRIVTDNIYDLAALVLPGSRPTMRNARAARLIAIKSDIRRNLSQQDLSIGLMARKHGISDSYARRLFAEDGATFSDFVLEQRLALAHRLLTDPRLAYRAISAIAFEVGFGDLSYFNRTFRRRYGMTPTDARLASRG